MSWWVVNQVSRPGGPRGPQQTNYVIVQAATAPINKVAGPYATKADATTWQSSANSAGNSPGSVAGRTADDLFKGLNLSSWAMRIGEIVAGAILLAIGVNAIAKNKPLQIVTGAAGMAAKVVP